MVCKVSVNICIYVNKLHCVLAQILLYLYHLQLIIFYLFLFFFCYVSQAVTEPSDNSNDECSAEVYVGTVCRASLHSLQSCIPDRCNTTEIYIPSTGLQDQIEQQLSTLVGGLQLVNPSPDCQAAILPFLCSYYFGLCDSSDHLHAPALQDCVLIANQTCAREFQIAVSLLGRENLPKCETLSIGATLQLECDGECRSRTFGSCRISTPVSGCGLSVVQL